MGKNILVSGLITMETNVSIESFPIEYSPVDYRFNGLASSISGVGYNLVKALKTLGSSPLPASIIGNDMYGDMIYKELGKIDIENKYVLPLLSDTCQSVILYDSNRRKIYLDLKNIQETNYPIETLENMFHKIDLAVCCNINYSRALLKPLRELHVPIASDVQAISDIDDSFNHDFMKYSDILFFSNVHIQGHEIEFINELVKRYNHKIIVTGMGEEGALLYVKADHKISKIPSVYTRKVVNTVGAGDSLFSSFLHFYMKTGDPYESIKRAAIFASYKIGESGGAKGFLTENEVLEWEKKQL
jgi:ribokinase